MSTVDLTTLHWGEPHAGGADARPTALLLHGLPSAAGTWWRVADALADRGWAVTAPDLRGHGASPRTVRYRLEDYAADVARLTPAGRGSSGGAPWNLVIGHSLGGAVAVVAAHAHPEWARALLLLDPVLTVAPEEADGLVAELLPDLEALDAAALHRAHPRWHVEDAVQKVNAARVVSPYTVERTIRDNPDWALVETVAGLPVRVRVLAADPALGATFTAATGERLAREAADFGFRVLQGVSHSVHREDVDAVVAAAEEAVAELPEIA
ncbi:alpha/beta hydrolase [Herbiconiux moechotypicola]|uniref:AB hydrolase-1 domain-containing protein n=1 Tax=Herbiconiux moechotypicola TaxID=637393 RepID=A0ABN3DVX8_9MICO|nr:alpha/beta hydrolase [Herbiconiux moechotypicola]MCS5730944.1 alpha/beta hydrolase [Herbiconiux moechotypicola]